jgi:hypothetical protein
MNLVGGLVEEILWISLGFSGIAVVLCLACGVFATLDLIDVRAIRRLLRQRRFGLVSIFGFMAIVAIDLTLLRSLEIKPTEPAALFFGAIFFIVGLVIVAYVGLVLTDITEPNTSAVKRKDTLPDEFNPPPPRLGNTMPDGNPSFGFLGSDIPPDIDGERWDEWI